jgi:hypothetical protein
VKAETQFEKLQEEMKEEKERKRGLGVFGMRL